MEDQDMTIYDTAIFTGNPDVDTYILSQLSNEQLGITCQVNDYAHHLCQNNYELKSRLNNEKYNYMIKNKRFKQQKNLDFQTNGIHPKTGRQVVIDGRLYNSIMNDYKKGKLNNFY